MCRLVCFFFCLLFFFFTGSICQDEVIYEVIIFDNFCYFFTEMYFVDTHWNCLSEYSKYFLVQNK